MSRGRDILFVSSEEQSLLSNRQGPMADTSSDDLEHRQVRSGAVQLMSVAASSRHPSAQDGSWETRLRRSVVLLAEVDVVGEAA